MVLILPASRRAVRGLMATSWALPAAIVAAVYLVRESVAPIKEGVEYVENLVDDSIKRVINASEEAGGAVASSGEYYGKLVRDKMRENAARAAIAEGIIVSERRTREQTAGARGQLSNYGTVSNGAGSFTGLWEQHPGGKCRVVYNTAYASNTWKIFSGGYCRRAAALGLLPPGGV